MKKILYTAAFIAITIGAQAQNVGINTTGVTPSSNSVLDLNTGNNFSSPNGKGLLPPNVSLTGITDNVTVASPSSSLLVYNTATANTGTLSVVPGFYYWNGTKWVRLQTSAGTANDWNLLGNAGTTAGTNFLGTTDAQDMVFKTNSLENMRIANATGNVGIGTSTPGQHLDILNGAALVRNTDTLRSALISSDGGIELYRDATAPVLMQNGYVDFKSNPIFDFSARLTYDHTLGTAGAFCIRTNAFSTGLGIPRMAVDVATGNIGIGTTSPSVKLDIENGSTNGAIKIADGTQGAGKVLTSDVNGVGTWLSSGSKFFQSGTGANTTSTVSGATSASYVYVNNSITIPEAGTYLLFTTAHITNNDPANTSWFNVNYSTSNTAFSSYSSLPGSCADLVGKAGSDSYTRNFTNINVITVPGATTLYQWVRSTSSTNWTSSGNYIDSESTIIAIKLN